MNIKRIIYHRQTQVCTALIGADYILFTAIDPIHASAAWLITGYALLGLTLFGVASLLAQTFRSYGEKAHDIARRFLRYGAAAAVLLIGLQSVGQLTTKDVLTLMPLTVLAYLYFGYGHRLARQPAANK